MTIIVCANGNRNFRYKKDMKNFYKVNESHDEVTVNPQEKSRTNSYLPVFTMLLMLTLGVGNAWGYYYAKMNVVSSPSTGGYVYVGNSSSCSSSNCTKNTDDATSNRTGGLFATSGNITFYLCNKPKSGYVFKGWSDSENNNSGLGVNNNPYSLSVKGTTLTPSFTYYAIFARLASSTASGSSFNFEDVVVGEESGTKTLTINHAHAGTVSLSKSGNSDDFELSESSFTSVAEGSKAITIKFKPTTNGLRTCTLTVSSNNGLSSLTYYLTGKGFSKPSITWVDGNGNELTSGETTLSAGDVLRATCATGQAISYSDYNSAYFTPGMDADSNPILTVREDITGTINNLSVTASVTKDNTNYNAANSSVFSLNVTNLTPQEIEWTDDISDLSNENMPYTITLSAVAKNAKTGAASGLPVTYSMASNASLSLSGNVLTVRALGGPIAITASVAGNESYAPASVTKYATVINMTDPCATSDNHNGGTLNRDSKNFDIYPTVPKQLTFRVTKSSNLFLADLEVIQYNANGTQLEKTTIGYGDISTSGTNRTINCNANTTRIRFNAGAYLGYSYTISNVKTTRNTTSSVSENALSYDVTKGQSLGKDVTITYSNIPVFLSFKSDEDANVSSGKSLWSLNTAHFGSCGKKGSQTVRVTFMSNTKGDFSDKLYVRNNVGDLLHTIDLTASVTAQNQFLDRENWNIKDEYLTTEQTTLSAATRVGHTDFTFTVQSANPAGCVTIANGVMTFSASGTAVIKADLPEIGIYEAFTAAQNITINKSTPDIATAPTGTSIVYLQTLNKSTLSGGAADITLRGVAHTPVAGSFAWTEPTHVVMDAAGSHSYSVTFTPTDGGMYTTKELTIPITILRAEQSLSMNNGTVKVAVDGIDAGAADSKIDLDGLTASQTGDVVNNVKRDGAVTYEVISSNKANATIGEGNIFSATVCGTYTIRATKAQTDYYNVVTDEFTVTVVKRDNTLATTAAYTRYVDDVIATVATTVNSDGTIHTSTSDGTIAYYDVAQNKIFIPNSEAKSFNSTTVTIKIWQDATDRFEGITEANAKTITLTVKKYDNPFACSWGSFAKTVNFDEVVPTALTTQNTDYTHFPIEIEQTSGEKIATLVRNDNTNNTITASHFVGDATWHMTQAENYKYKAGAADLSLSVRVIDNEECYMFEDNTEHEFTTKITDGSGHFDDPIAVSGPVNKLYFDARRDILAVSKFIVQYSVDNGSHWRTIAQPDLTISYKSFGPYEFTGLAANEHVSHIRFGAEVGGTLSKYYKNVRISRTTNIMPLDANGNHITTLTMPQSTVDGSTTAQFYLNYSSCDDVIKIVSDNAHFTVDISEISVDHSKDFNNATITVTYHSNDKGTHTGTITIYTKYQNETLTVTGKTDKKIQTLTWEKGYTESTLSLPVGLVVDNVNYAVSASSGKAVIYTTDNDQVIEIIQAGLGFKIIGEGTATLTATQAGNDDWFPVSDSKTINATFKKLQEIVWTQDFIRNMEVGQEIALDAKVYIRDLKNGTFKYNAAQTALITYSCPTNTVIALDGENKKITVTGYGQTSITASLPTGNDYYEDATPVTMIVKVRKPSEGCETPWVVDEASTIELFDDNVLGGSAIDFSNWTTPELTSDPILLDPANGKPDKLSYQHDAEQYAIGRLKICSGKVVAQQRVNGIWSDITGSAYEQNYTLTDWAAGAYTWREVKDLQIDENADAIRFKRFNGGAGHHKFKDVQISRLHYLRPTAAEVDLGDITIGEDRPATIGIDYSDIKKDLSAAKGNEENTTYSVDESTIYVECGSFGHYDLPITIHPIELGPWSNTVIVTDKMTGETVTIVVNANVIPEFIHTYEVAGEWGEQTHWKDDKKPTYKDDVRIAADVTIVSDITVNGITIEPNVTVTVNPGVTLTLRDGVSRPRVQYGNLHVKDGGKVVVGTGAFMINDFILDAALGTIGTSASSGQVLDDNDRFIVNGDAYFLMTLNPSGENTLGWYDFVVPFQADVKDLKIIGCDRPLVFNDDYAVMRYDEAKRAVNGKDWQKFNGTMEPGRVYTIAVDADHPEWNTVLFKKKKGGTLGAPASFWAECSTTGETKDCGWNGLGNGTLQHIQLNAASVRKIEVYDHTNNIFETLDEDEVSNLKFAVGTSFFIQVDEAQPIVFDQATDGHLFLAPAREQRTIDEFRLVLTAEDAPYASDRLWVSASEEATGEYTVGHDLLKMGTPSEAKLAQMWAVRENERLCDVEMPLMSNKAQTPMSFFAPSAGTYTLAVDAAPDDATLYLTQNGNVIWNLSVSPYTIDLKKGTTEGYGLKLVAERKVSTDVENVQSGDMQGAKCRKVLIDDKMYIIMPDGAMFEATGKKVK